MKHHVTFPGLLLTSLAAVVLAIAPACRTTVYGPERCPVEISPDGTVQVGGKLTSIDDIAGRLKSMGFAQSAMIRVAVPDGVQRDTLTRVSSALVAGGYTQFFFVKPLQKESFAKEEAQKTQPPPPQPPAKPSAGGKKR